MADEAPFVFVSKKKAARKKYQKCNRTVPHKGPEDNLFTDDDVVKLVDKVNQCKCEITSSGFWKKLKETLTTIQAEKFKSQCVDDSPLPDSLAPQDIVCYGVGNFAECLIAQYQLALLLIIREELKVPCSQCLLYDPMFSPLEASSLPSLGGSLLPNNEAGKRSVCRPTLFFMPHCGKPLYNNLLWANWQPQGLKYLTILGNSFQNMVTSIPQRFLEKEASFILECNRFVTEVPVENAFPTKVVFNDLGVHWFPTEVLAEAPASTWIPRPAPTYEDSSAEIIMESCVPQS